MRVTDADSGTQINSVRMVDAALWPPHSALERTLSESRAVAVWAAAAVPYINSARVVRHYALAQA